MKRAGFTLLEVLLASLLLAFLALTLFSTVRETLLVREDIDLKTETLQTARASFTLLERDIRAAYFLTPEDLGWNPKQPADWPKDQPWVAPPRPAAVTIFQGKNNEVFFNSRTHQRLSVDSPENEEHFVTYQLHGDELVRAESARAVNIYDREDPDRFHQFIVVNHVKTFKLTYYDSRAERWQDDWDTEKPEFKERLPDAVKIEMEFSPDEENSSARRKPKPIKIASVVAPAYSTFKADLTGGVTGGGGAAGAIGPGGPAGGTTGGGRGSL